MKKLLALLMTLLLIVPAAQAEFVDLTDEECIDAILAATKRALDAEEIEYEFDDEYDCCYFSNLLEQETQLGCADLTLYAYWDGLCICVSYREAVPENARAEITKLLNDFNAGIYIGKFYLDAENYLCFEVYLPMEAENITAYNEFCITDYMFFAFDMLDTHQDYFIDVINGTETAENVYAMWLADIY
ncbi:MAG: YbjN domain-containing protein [Clostridia bacterium]|nr:YbjN domain-containing protein [Clostridia bacterium]